MRVGRGVRVWRGVRVAVSDGRGLAVRVAMCEGGSGVCESERVAVCGSAWALCLAGASSAQALSSIPSSANIIRERVNRRNSIELLLVLLRFEIELHSLEAQNN